MLPTARYCLLILVLAAICLPPAFALQNLRQVDLSPPSLVLPPGTRLNASAVIEILPSGASTYPEGHTLVLGTDLTDARWNVMVIGRRASGGSDSEDWRRGLPERVPPFLPGQQGCSGNSRIGRERPRGS